MSVTQHNIFITNTRTGTHLNMFNQLNIYLSLPAEWLNQLINLTNHTTYNSGKLRSNTSFRKRMEMSQENVSQERSASDRVPRVSLTINHAFHLVNYVVVNQVRFQRKRPMTIGAWYHNTCIIPSGTVSPYPVTDGRWSFSWWSGLSFSRPASSWAATASTAAHS